MKPRIAIPIPNSIKPDYAMRALPQYEHAVRDAGGDPVIIDVTARSAAIAQKVKTCDGVLLPGSPADVDPEKYGATRHPATADADVLRDNADELLLQDAYNMRKPVLGICYGLQMLNVYRTGTLLQHIESPVNHAAGRKVPVAHAVEIDPGSILGDIVAEASGKLAIPVNSSHHQAADVIGDGLRAVARSPQDNIVEAVEGTSPDHFVLAVQWHPERSVHDDEPSRAIFRALIQAARARHRKLVGEFEGL